MAKKAAPLVNPFGVARVKAPAAEKPKTHVFVAEAVIDASGAVRYPQDAVKDALGQFIEGKKLLDQGKGLQDTSRPVIEAFGYQIFAQQWLREDRRPDNPKLTSIPDGTGSTVGFIVQDRQANLNPDEYANLCNLVGTEVAETLVEDTQVFSFNSDTLAQKITIKDVSGKDQTKLVQDFVAEALQLRFADHPEVMQTLLEVKPVFRTAPGVIDKGLALVAKVRDKTVGERLVAWLTAIKATVSLKATK
jgi:hypothetical protein